MVTVETSRYKSVRMELIAELRMYLQKLLQNRIDQFELLNLAQRLSVKLDKVGSFSKQKALVQMSLLEQILKEDIGNPVYQNLLDRTRQSLGKVKSSNYFCCLVGCLFTTSKHRSYLHHLKSTHANSPNLQCNFRHSCKRKFTKFQTLLGHVRECHTLSTSSEVIQQAGTIPLNLMESCQCNMIRCRDKKFSDIQSLMTHINNYHKKETRECIFDQCLVKFSAGQTSAATKHFREKHTKLNQLKLKSKYKIIHDQQNQTHNVIDSGNVINECSTFDADDLPSDCPYSDEFLDSLSTNASAPEGDGSQESDGVGDQYLLKHLADFLNRMTSVNFIPNSTVQEIFEEYLEQFKRSKALTEMKLRKALREIASLNDETIEKVVEVTFGDDFFLKAQQELGSIFKREKFIHENFNFVAPVEIVLNPDYKRSGEHKDVIHYVPVLESLRNLLEDKSFCSVIEHLREEKVVADIGILRDLMDGKAFQSNTYFVQNPDAYCGHFYSDSIELSNPLGAAKGKHKVNQVFYTIAQIPKEQRSRIDRMQLCMVYKDKLVKKYGYKKIFHKLIEDLKILETGFRFNDSFDSVVKFGILAYSGDNLESHCLGGFSSCFSSKDICRFCHINYDQLSSCIHDYISDEPHEPWTIDEYDRICNEIEKCGQNDDQICDNVVTDDNLFFESETADNESNEYDYDDSSSSDTDLSMEDENEPPSFHGLRQRCPFNELEAFHAVVSFPPDVMHDLMEGVIAQV